MYLNYLRYVQQKCLSFPELLQYFLVRFDDNATFRRYEHFCVANLSDISYCLTLPWFMLWIFTTSFLFAPVRTFFLTQSLACSHSLVRSFISDPTQRILCHFSSVFHYFAILTHKEKEVKAIFWSFLHGNDVGLFASLQSMHRFFFSAFSSYQLIFKPLEIVEWKILLLSRWSCRSRHRHRQRSIAAFA